MLLSPMASAVASANLFTMFPSLRSVRHQESGEDIGGDARTASIAKRRGAPTFDSCRKQLYGKSPYDSQDVGEPVKEIRQTVILTMSSHQDFSRYLLKQY
jgi:ABC-type branched-subunit amino acid transport system ATPase component